MSNRYIIEVFKNIFAPIAAHLCMLRHSIVFFRIEQNFQEIADQAMAAIDISTEHRKALNEVLIIE